LQAATAVFGGDSTMRAPRKHACSSHQSIENIFCVPLEETRSFLQNAQQNLIKFLQFSLTAIPSLLLLRTQLLLVYKSSINVRVPATEINFCNNYGRLFSS
jgi:hypothetical protein